MNKFLFDPYLIDLRKRLSDIEKLMQKGICLDGKSGRKFYTGYIDKILFDWDQFFEAIIQIYMGWDGEYIKNGVLVFLDNQNESGLITRSIPDIPPNENEHAKPFLSQIIYLYYNIYNEIEWLTDSYYLRLKKYIDYWLFEMDSNKNGLSEWMSSIHTGMDNQHERAGYWNERFCEGVDLNSYLYMELSAFSKISEILKYDDNSLQYKTKAGNIKKLILENMWDDKDNFYYDIDIRTGKKIKIKSISSFMPLWAGIAEKDHAKKMAYNHLLNPEEFWSPYPVSALSKTDKGYSRNFLPGDIGCNWRANTWIPTNYMIFRALLRYGFNEIASEIADRTLDLLDQSGSCEYYDTETGEGLKQKPFWGWSLLGYFMRYEYRYGGLIFNDFQ